MAATQETIAAVEEATGQYKYGFVTDIETEKAPKGLNEDIIRFISAKKKNEPEWMLEWRLESLCQVVDDGIARLGKIEYS